MSADGCLLNFHSPLIGQWEQRGLQLWANVLASSSIVSEYLTLPKPIEPSSLVLPPREGMTEVFGEEGKDIGFLVTVYTNEFAALL